MTAPEQWSAPPPAAAQWTAPEVAPPVPRQRRWPIVVAAVAAAVVGVGTYLVQKADEDHRIAGYGQDAVKVAHKLGGCSEVTDLGGSAARCALPSGSAVAVATSKDEGGQSFLVAVMKDRSAGDCAAVLPGVIVVAPSEAVLTEAVGIPEAFAARNGGYLLCPI